VTREPETRAGGHLDADQLALAHYGEDAGAGAEAHLEACESCRQRLRELARTLALARPDDAPERGPEYGAAVWARLRPRLGLPEPEPAPSRVLAFRGRVWPRVLTGGALAAALVLAFLLGRRFPEAPQPLAPEVRERVLLVAVGEHLDRSRLVLVELANAPSGESLNVRAQRAVAQELVASGRLYRQAAARDGDPALAAVLEELERLLVEVAAGPDEVAPADLAGLQRRIESRGLIFKVRVIGTQVRERERELAPRGASVS
jgi:hypothetical protein